MRVGSVSIVVGALLTALAGCSGADGPSVYLPQGAPVTPSSASASRSASASPSAVPRDLTLKLTNAPGYPACGFRTYVMDFYGQKVTHFNLLVAVAPTGGTGDVGVLIHLDGVDMTTSAVFRDGAVVRGKSYTPDGAGFFYLSESAGVIPGAGDFLLTRTSTVTVTVDAGNRVAETNESNNVLTMKLRAPNRSRFEVTDSTCTVS